MQGLQSCWYRICLLHIFLIPLGLIFAMLATTRRWLYRCGLFHSVRLPIPVVIVGNISVGGTGKTPLTLWLAQQLIARGWHPGIISRGYRHTGSSAHIPLAVSPDSASAEVGDEPVLMAQRRLCPVWVGRDRPAVAQALLNAHPECDILLSDDGMQHYRLQRDVEIAVVDASRRFGNGWMLPAGPLREPVSRLKSVSAIVIHGDIEDHFESAHPSGPATFAMSLQGSHFYNLLEPATVVTAQHFAGQAIHAIAGIGNPLRFFQRLQQLGLNCTPHAFPDHHPYCADDLAFDGDCTLLMTEKDAVKCAPFATAKYWVLRVDAVVAPNLAELIIDRIRQK